MLTTALLVSEAPAHAAGPASPPLPAGALVIVGGGGLSDAIRDRFLELAGGPQARLVIIPTASHKAERPETLTTVPYFQAQKTASVVLLHTRDRRVADTAGFVQPLTVATGVWLCGGDQSKLTAAYHGTAVERELHRLLARGGVIGGTSAGASAMSVLMITGGNPVARVGPGLGLLPGVVIDQHFGNRKRLPRLLGVLDHHPQYLGLGIDEGTAVVLRGRSLSVLGKSAVRVCLSRSGTKPSVVKVLQAGDQADLSTWVQAAAARAQAVFAAAGKTTPAPPPGGNGSQPTR